MNVCGNVEQEYTGEEIESQLKAEFISALQPALGSLSQLEIRPSAIPAHVGELADAMNRTLSRKWRELRGLSVVSIALNSVTLPEEDAQMIKFAQKNAMFRDPAMAAANLAGVQADAMKAAASNAAGAMTGFMGMGMANQAGGMNLQELYQMGAQQTQQSGVWQCSCGTKNTGKFCSECGQMNPLLNQPWRCSCGAVNKGKFCSECGSPRPSV